MTPDTHIHCKCGRRIPYGTPPFTTLNITEPMICAECAK